MNLKAVHRLSLILASSIVLYSCTKEDLKECSLQLQLKYDYSMEDEVMNFVDLYVFDKQDKFIELLQVDLPKFTDNYKIAVPHYYKDKTLVVWAGETRESYSTSPLQVGDAMDSLMLKHVTIDNTSTQKLSNLFHGGEELMTFDGVNHTHTIDFTRTDNRINLSLQDANNKNMEIEGKYDVKLTACNAVYSSDHMIASNSPRITYLPTNYASTPKRETRTKQTSAHLHTLRLHELYREDVKLTIYNTEQQQYITFGGEPELKLIEYLLQTTPNETSAQAYLDNKSEWNISFAVAEDAPGDKDIALNITINGWVIWFNDIEL